jgi:hypothetical protein
MVRLLYLPNEPDEADPTQHQIGPRKAFSRLQDEGVISSLEIFSFLSKYRKGTPISEINRELLDIVDRFQPDIVFWQHVSEFPVEQEFIETFKRRARYRLLVYHEEDPYDGRVKRISPAMRVLLTNCDIAFSGGLEPMSGLMRRYGARDVRLLLHNYDNVRSGTPWDPPYSRPYDVVMIANSIRRRLLRTYLPGGNRRAELARSLSHRFGKSFALFGNGWAGLQAARGPLPFSQQEKTIRNAWISVNWDHFDRISYYSSDRLPISLAAGVVHVTTYHTGYDSLFKDCPGLYAVKSVEDAVSCVEWLLSRPKEVLIAEGLAAKKWAEAHLEADGVFRQAIMMCLDKLNMKINASDGK